MTTVDDRYARPGRARRALLVGLVAAIALVGLVWLMTTAWTRSTPAVAARVKAYDVRDEHETSVTLTVDRRDPGARVVCRVFVQAANFERVGEKEVTVDPGSQRVTDVTVGVRTFRRATSASLDHCRPAG